MEELLKEIYELYKEEIEYEKGYKGEFSSISEEYIEEGCKQSLNYMAELLNKVRDEYNKR